MQVNIPDKIIEIEKISQFFERKLSEMYPIMIWPANADIPMKEIDRDDGSLILLSLT